MYKKSPKGWAKHWDFILLDEIAIVISFFLAFVIRHGARNPLEILIYRNLFFVSLIVNVLVSVIFNTFSGVLKRRRFRLILDTMKHVILVMVFNITYTFVVQSGDEYSRIMVFLMAGIHFVLGLLAKFFYRRFWFKHHSKRPVFLLTTKDRAETIIRDIQNNIRSVYNITEAAIVDEDMVGQQIAGVHVVANKDDVIKHLTRSWVTEIFYSVPRELELHDTILPLLMEMGITVHVDLGNLFVVEEHRQEVERMGHTVVLTTAINTVSGWKALLKRVMDIIGGLIGSLAALIIMAIVAVPIKKASPGPLLYTSERIGLNGKHFRMYKIRSMYLDADARKAELMSQNRVKDGMMFKLDWDPRIIGNREENGERKTGIGEFIRKTSLDEFPQFFNVLKGDMSLVGTRPPTPDEWEKYEAHHRARMSTKPGITGLWQVSGRSEITDFEEVVRLDTEYITHWSLGLDVKLLFKTIGSVLGGKGAM